VIHVETCRRSVYKVSKNNNSNNVLTLTYSSFLSQTERPTALILLSFQHQRQKSSRHFLSNSRSPPASFNFCEVVIVAVTTFPSFDCSSRFHESSFVCPLIYLSFTLAYAVTALPLEASSNHSLSNIVGRRSELRRGPPSLQPKKWYPPTL
jgi:hypothetical protein